MEQSDRTLQEEHLLGVYPRALGLEFVRGEGNWVIDSQGNRYLDLATGLGVNLFGYCDQEIIQTVQTVLSEGWHCSNLFYNRYARELAAELSSLSSLEKVFFSNSGAEAIETAIKIARRYGHREGKGRYRIVCFEQGWHGRTYGAISACHDPSQQEGCGPLLPGFDPIPLFDTASLQNAICKETLAILIEPILGHGGIRWGEPDFYDTVSKLCYDNNLILIVDEIQTGCGRSGSFFASDVYGLKPEIITLAKALGGGMAIGATLCSSRLSEVMGIGSHGSTIGGNPLATAVALTVVRKLKKASFLEKSIDDLNLLAELLQKRLDEKFELRRIGAMFGISVPHSAKKLTHALATPSNKSHTAIISTALGEKCLRLLPPLTLTREEISLAADTICSTIYEFYKD